MGQSGAGNPKGVIGAAVRYWLANLDLDLLVFLDITVAQLLLSCPSRWSVYPPMVLLPQGSFDTPEWRKVLDASDQVKNLLWSSILSTVTKTGGWGQLSHLAVNAGIPPYTKNEAENRMRSPSKLTILYGDFGPVWTETTIGERPSEKDFEDAFWVSTKQNGIQQFWAPRYTMFSRGNIKEKARLLQFHSAKQTTHSSRISQDIWTGGTAVDLYAGIGYFVFSYVAMGMQKVFCWEINPWSVEGLRRGARSNRWKVQVFRGQNLHRPMTDIIDLDNRIFVFEETNEHAVGRIAELRRLGASSGMALADDVVHVNCGLLPTSMPVWQSAVSLVSQDRGGWLHLHENVGIMDIRERKEEIERLVQSWRSNKGQEAIMEHVERVKTFAPGVWHCVFDVLVSSCKGLKQSDGIQDEK